MRETNAVFFGSLYSLVASLASTVYMHLDNGNYKLSLPLKSGERVFSLREHLSVSTFVEDVMAEDSHIKSVVVSDQHGKVAKSTPVQVLLGGDWTLEIDGRPVLIKSPPRSLVGKEYVSLHPDLAKPTSHLALLRAFLDNEGKAKTEVKLQDYISFAEDKGLTKAQALSNLDTLHKLGAVLHLPSNLELKDRILLNPHVVAAAIEKALSMPALRSETKKSLESHLEELRARAAELQPAYEAIDSKASRSVNFMGYSLLGALLFQWLLFARFTWWDFSWDVMEPVTYFTMTAELSIGGFLYYLYQGSEYTNQDIWTTLYNWRFRSIARRRRFNIEEWNAVNTGIIATQQQIAHHSE